METSNIHPPETNWREIIKSQYEVGIDGVIKSPGKFEGEMIYAPYFYDLWNSGCYDDLEYGSESGESAIFRITRDDLKMFPEIGTAQELIVWEDSTGFVYCREKC